MKITYRIPTKEPYAYVEVEQELEVLDGVLISENYKDLTKAIVNETEGLDNKTFIALLDELWDKESIQADPGIVETMSHSQKEIMRAFKLVIQRAKDRKK